MIHVHGNYKEVTKWKIAFLNLSEILSLEQMMDTTDSTKI